MSNSELYEPKTYWGLALDPIHVGTGGYRLGEVDLTIVREPGTNLPKIPGSSIAGVSRAYTAMAHGKYRREQEYDADEQKIRYVSCAGKGGKDGSDHCGEIDCPVCVTYGFTIGPDNRSFHGMAQFYDAHILFFPVHSMVGPVWVTSPGALADAGYALSKEQTVAGEQIRAVAGLVPDAAGKSKKGGLNLGWLFLEADATDLDADAIWNGLSLPPELEAMKGRLALVPDGLLSLVVDSNLEVRTSVSIEPATGAAEEGALFTYEALPRGTVLHFPVIFQNPKHYMFPEKGKEKPTPLQKDAQWVRGNVESGLRLMEYLGVGGMSTRGFGRMKVLNLDGGK